MNDKHHIGEHLRARRLAVKKTQGDIARAIGTTRQTVAKMENGQIGEVAFGTVEAFANEINLRLDLERIVIEMENPLLEDVEVYNKWLETNWPRSNREGRP